jgi:hypothetical protein
MWGAPIGILIYRHNVGAPIGILIDCHNVGASVGILMYCHNVGLPIYPHISSSFFLVILIYRHRMGAPMGNLSPSCDAHIVGPPIVILI